MMYKPYTVTFFGHRRLSNMRQIEQRLEEIVLTLLREHEDIDFLVGRNGDFDQLAASAVRRVREAYGANRATLTLILPYMTAAFRDNEDEFLRYYNSAEVFPCPPGTPSRACIPLRNRGMVDRADAVVCCVEHPCGGAWEALMYARTQRRRIISVLSECI